eukprot:191277-Chlamydomonas_euryale.AAC.1
MQGKGGGCCAVHPLAKCFTLESALHWLLAAVYERTPQYDTRVSRCDDATGRWGGCRPAPPA